MGQLRCWNIFAALCSLLSQVAICTVSWVSIALTKSAGKMLWKRNYNNSELSVSLAGYFSVKKARLGTVSFCIELNL